MIRILIRKQQVINKSKNFHIHIYNISERQQNISKLMFSDFQLEKIIFFPFFYFWDRVFRCYPGCLATHSVEQSSLDSQRSSSLYLQRAGINEVCHYHPVHQCVSKQHTQHTAYLCFLKTHFKTQSTWSHVNWPVELLLVMNTLFYCGLNNVSCNFEIGPSSVDQLCLFESS